MTKEHHITASIHQVEDMIHEYVRTNYCSSSELNKFRRAIPPERLHHLADKLWDLTRITISIESHNNKYTSEELK